jgi:hypothetical protein
METVEERKGKPLSCLPPGPPEKSPQSNEQNTQYNCSLIRRVCVRVCLLVCACMRCSRREECVARGVSVARQETSLCVAWVSLE